MVSQKSPDIKFIVKKGNVPHFNIRISLYDKTSRKEIGYIHLVPLSDKEWMEVLNVEIDPAWQRQGLGTKLYLKAKQTAQKAGYKGLASDPGGRTPDASKLWKSIPGAKRSGRGWWVLETVNYARAGDIQMQVNWLNESMLTTMSILFESLIPELHKYYTVADERYYPMAKIEKAIQDLEQAIADKHIYNVRWNEIKDVLNRAYDTGVRPKIGGYDSPYYLHQLSGYLKKSKDPSDMLRFWVKVADLLASAKAHIVKGRKPNPDAKPKPDEVIVRNWTPALDMLENKLKDIIKGTINKFKEQVEQQMIGKAKKIWQAMEQHGIDNDMDLYKYDREFGNSPFAGLMFDRISRKRVADYPQGEIAAIAAKQAQKIADQSAEHFISKNKFKLAAFLKHKQIKDIEVISMSVLNSIINSQMHFTFEDGSAFTVQNQMVYGSTQQGTQFVRYPTTFHAVLIGGQPMSGPSEFKIYKAFGISGAVPKDD